VIDSNGYKVNIATNDMIYVVCFSPSGTQVYKDSVLGNNAALKSNDWEDMPDDYNWPKTAGVLNGAATTYGTYVIHITAFDSSTVHPSTMIHTFELISANLNTLLARLDATITSRSTFAPGSDSVIVDGSSLAATAGAISVTTIAAGAITSSEAPNLDAAISSRSTYAPGTDSVIVDGSSLAMTPGAISSTTIAAGAITSSEAPNLDAAITSRSTFAPASDSVIVKGTAMKAIAALSRDSVWLAQASEYDSATGTMGLVNCGINWFAGSTIMNELASMAWRLSIATGARTVYRRHAAVDTNLVINPAGTDTIYQVRKHPAGVAGGTPDSTEVAEP
jgi:hypothetical protein